jgi:hypothetical protein
MVRIADLACSLSAKLQTLTPRAHSNSLYSLNTPKISAPHARYVDEPAFDAYLRLPLDSWSGEHNFLTLFGPSGITGSPTPTSQASRASVSDLIYSYILIPHSPVPPNTLTDTLQKATFFTSQHLVGSNRIRQQQYVRNP